MRRYCVTEIVVMWQGGSMESFPTQYEAEMFINFNLDDLGEPLAAWREDMKGNKKWDYRIEEDEEGKIVLAD